MDQTNPNNSTNLTPKKYKVVLLGDQSVGKTSIIKAYGDHQFNPDTDVWLAHPANRGSRFCDEVHQARQQADKATDMGYGWTGEVQSPHSFIH